MATRHLLACVALATSTALTACGGNGGGQDDAEGIPPSQDLVATAVRRADPATVVLSETETAEYLESVYAAKWGLSASSRQCAAAALVDAIGPGAPVFEYLSGEAGNRAEASAVQTCSTPEDTARAELQQPAPDLDIEMARGALAGFAAAQARSAGLSDTEAECYGTELAGAVSEGQLAALFARRGFESDLDLGEVVAGCVPAERLDELAAAIVATATTAPPG